VGAVSNFALLKDFGRETSSDKRRELLRRATEMFIVSDEALSAQDSALLDEVVQAMTAELSASMRADLARKVASSGHLLNRSARTLAMDDIEIARPVLESSSALTERDLLDVVEQKTGDHMMAITRRTDIGTNVSSALVTRGEDRVVASLLENQTAAINEETYERVVKRAETSRILQAPIVRRKNVPLHLLNDLVFRVEANLRQEILQQFTSVSPEDLNAALRKSKRRLAQTQEHLTREVQAARRHVDQMDRQGQLVPPVLVTLLREGATKRPIFIQAFAKMTDMPDDLIDRLVSAGDLDALAMLCRASGFDRALFVTLAAMIIGGENPLSRIEEFGALYLRVPTEAAQRAIRFWKVRSSAA